MTWNSGLLPQDVVRRQRTFGKDVKPEVFLDPNTLSNDGSVSMNGMSFSPDGSLMAYGLSKSGSDWLTIHVRDTVTGKDLPDKVENSRVPTVHTTPLHWMDA